MRKFLIVTSLLASGGIALADASYELKIDAPKAKKAQKGVAKIHVTPGAGFHVNKDYPTTVSVVPAGCTVEKPKQTAADAVSLTEKSADFDVAFTCNAAGKQTFTGEMKFAVCSASSCDPKKEKLSFTVDVN
jgi:hypothetical protein